MRLLITNFCLLIKCITVTAQLSLQECVTSGLANKPDLKKAQADIDINALAITNARAKYLPEISLAYDYRYNAVIPSQIVPIGQLNAIPTEETRAIQFGTRWQQNAGVTVYQPLIDFVKQSKVAERKLKKLLAVVDQQKLENELVLEIATAYSRAVMFEYALEEAVADTTRTATSLAIIKARFEEGRILKSELNTALINHYNNLTSYRNAVASLLNEKVLLHYLTGIDLERLMASQFERIPEQVLREDSVELIIDSLADYRKLLIDEKLREREMRTARRKYSPTIGLQGFLDGNQFTQQFDPFANGTWFGNSYVGLAIALPIFKPESTVNEGKQLQLELLKLNHEKSELKSSLHRDMLQVDIEIEQLAAELNYASNNCDLLKENVALFQERFAAGQYAAGDLNGEEANLQKALSKLKRLEADLAESKIRRLHIAGILKSRFAY